MYYKLYKFKVDYVHKLIVNKDDELFKFLQLLLIRGLVYFLYILKLGVHYDLIKKRK